MLIPVGFWSKGVHDTTSEFPFPMASTLPTQAPLAILTRYLTVGALLESYEHGFSSCRLCGKANGCATLTDGTYVWPEGLFHYIAAHGVQLPVPFVSHMISTLAAQQQQPGVESLEDPRIADWALTVDTLLPLRNHLLLEGPLAGAAPTLLPRATIAYLSSLSSVLDFSGAAAAAAAAH
jgi:hypothetical protein